MKKSRFVAILSLISICVCYSCKTTQPGNSNPGTTIKNNTNTGETAGVPDAARTDPAFLKILKPHSSYFKDVLEHKVDRKVQVIYTQIDRSADNTPHFKDFYFNVNQDAYFYPEATVKLPIILLSLQKINGLGKFNIDKNSLMITEDAYKGQTPVYNDPTSEDGQPSIAQYIKRALLTDDKGAINRLFEWCSPAYIQEQLQQKGYPLPQINHRLGLRLSDDENRHTNPIRFLDSSAKALYEQPALINRRVYPKRSDYVGTDYYETDVLINEPMNFSVKNRLSLPDLHTLMKATIFPQNQPETKRFSLTPSDYRFITQYLHLQAPVLKSLDNGSAPMPTNKFLLAGGVPNPLPAGVKIFNISGAGYGFLVDGAYIVDVNTKTEFMLSGVIYYNTDGIVKEDPFEDKTAGVSFLKHLGEVIYAHELKRSKTHLPNLDSITIVNNN